MDSEDKTLNSLTRPLYIAKMSRLIYLAADGSLSITNTTQAYTPLGSQSLVSVKYSGMNRCDLTFFHAGLHSYTTGFEFAGTIGSTLLVIIITRYYCYWSLLLVTAVAVVPSSRNGNTTETATRDS